MCVCRMAALVQIYRGKMEIVAKAATAWRCQSLFLVSWELGRTSGDCFLLLSSSSCRKKQLQGKELLKQVSAMCFHSTG